MSDCSDVSLQGSVAILSRKDTLSVMPTVKLLETGNSPKAGCVCRISDADYASIRKARGLRKLCVRNAYFQLSPAYQLFCKQLRSLQRLDVVECRFAPPPRSSSSTVSTSSPVPTSSPLSTSASPSLFSSSPSSLSTSPPPSSPLLKHCSPSPSSSSRSPSPSPRSSSSSSSSSSRRSPSPSPRPASVDPPLTPVDPQPSSKSVSAPSLSSSIISSPARPSMSETSVSPTTTTTTKTDDHKDKRLPVSALGCLLSRLRSVVAISFELCRLTSGSLQLLFEALPGSVTSLNVAGNELDDAALSALVTAVERLGALQTLCVERSTSRYAAEAAERLVQTLARRQWQLASLGYSAEDVVGAASAERLNDDVQRLLRRNKNIQTAVAGKKRLLLRGCLSSSEELAAVPWQLLDGCTLVDLQDNACLTLLPAALRSMPASVERVLLSGEYLDPLEACYAASGSVAQMLAYLNDLRDSHAVVFPEVRLMVVGRAAVGKTTLVRRLRDEAFATALLSTDGIELGSFTVDDVRFVSYDFGGQKVYRYTHQLLLGNNTLYLLLFSVVDPPAVSVAELVFWLQSITMRTRARSSAFLVVGTHADRLPSSSSRVDHSSAAAIAEQVDSAVRQLFPELRFARPLAVNSTDAGRGWLRQLRQQLVAVARTVAPSLPASVTHARHAVERLCRELPVPVMPLAQLSDAVGQQLAGQGIRWSPGTRAAVLDALQLLGVVTVVREFADSPAEYCVLSAQWMVRLFASIVTTRHNYVQSSRGILLREHLQHIWSDAQLFPAHLHDTMLNLLHTFDIVFPLDLHTAAAARRYLVSCLLPNDLPDQTECRWTTGRAVSRLFVFQQQCPVGLMPRIVGHLISSCGDQDSAAAQSGCVGRRHGLDFRVAYSSPRRDAVLVQIASSAAATLQSLCGVSRLLAQIAALVQQLVTDYFGLDYQLVVPCVSSSCCFPMRTIQAAVAAGEHSASCTGGQHRQSVVDLAPDVSLKLGSACPLTPWRDVHLLRKLGTGSSGVVWQAELRRSADVAVKILERDDKLIAADDSHSSGGDALVEAFQHEVGMMMQCVHPNVVRLLGLAVQPLAMIMELLPCGDLFAQLHDPHRLRRAATLIDEVRRAVGNTAAAGDAAAAAVRPRRKLDAVFATWLTVCGADNADAVAALQADTRAAVARFVAEPSRASDALLTDCQARADALVTAQLEQLAPVALAVRLKIACDVAAGLRFLHAQSPPVLHRDIKTPNVMLRRSPVGLQLGQLASPDEPVALLGDLGLSVRMQGVRDLRIVGESAVMRHINPTWAAPEVLHGSAYSLPSDVYGYGVLLCELLGRRVPWADVNPLLLPGAVQSGMRPPLPDDCPDDCRALVQHCWANNPSARPTAAAVCRQLHVVCRATPLAAAVLGPVDCLPVDQPRPTTASRVRLEERRLVLPPAWLSSPPPPVDTLVLSDQANCQSSLNSQSLNSQSLNSQALNTQSSSSQSPTTMRLRSACVALSLYLWLGFRNGCVGCVAVETLQGGQQRSAAVTFVSPLDRYEQAVDALTYTPANGGQVWAGGSGGRIEVYAAAPKSGCDAVEHLQLRGDVELLDKKRERWTPRWLLLESGVLRLYERRVTGRECLAVQLHGHARAEELAAQLAAWLSDGGGEQLTVGAATLRSRGDEAVSLTQLARLCVLCLSTRAEPLQLCQLGSASTAAPVTALRTVNTSVWSLSVDQVLCEWELCMDDHTGLRPDRRQLAPRRTVSLAGVEVLPRLRCVSGFVRASNSAVWCLLGNRVVAVDVAHSPPLLLPSDDGDGDGPARHQHIITAACAVAHQAGAATEIWTADGSGHVVVWTAQDASRAPLYLDSFDVAGSPMAMHAVPGADQVWFGLGSGDIVRLSVSGRRPVSGGNDDDRQPHAEAVSAIVSCEPDVGQAVSVFAVSWDQTVSTWRLASD